VPDVTPTVRRAAVVLVAATAIAAGAFLATRQVAGRLGFDERCTARAAGTTAHLSLEQADNAASIAAVASRRGLPARAATIALATAMQESKLRNLDYGDRDSLGLFQQRPSQGWGTPSEVLNPVHAANSFFDELVKIGGYRTMDIGHAAQLVQRSGHPDAYAHHEPQARALASALMGYSPAAFTCTPRSSAVAGQDPGRDGRTPRAEAAVTALDTAFGPQHPAAAADPRVVDLHYPIAQPDARRAGWASAQWLVAKASALKVSRVTFDGKIWRADHSAGKWLPVNPAGPGGGAASLPENLRFEVR